MPNDAPRKSRDGHAQKSAANKPAKIESANGAKSRERNTQPPPFDDKKIAEDLNLWRLSTAPVFYAPQASGESWRELTAGDVKRLLRIAGVASKPGEGERISHADLVIEYVHNWRTVDFAGPLAGYKPGVHYDATGRPFIVTVGPRLIEPRKGGWSLIREIIENRLDRNGYCQSAYFYAWLRGGVAPLYEGRRRKGPALILAGPEGSGKSFLQNLVITPALGGRPADPTDYLRKDDGFNKAVMSSESLVMEEFPFSADIATRLKLSEKLKKLVASDTQSYHPKGRDALTVSPQLRLSITMNNLPEKLRALPPLEKDWADKVIMLAVAQVPMPMPTDTDEQEAALREAVTAQMPAFLHWLLYEWQPEPELTRGRFGVATWQHPELAKCLEEQSAAHRFAHLLDVALATKLEWKDGKGEPWGWGEAVELETWLKTEAEHSDQFRGLLRFDGACSVFLGQLRAHEIKNDFAGSEARQTDCGRYVWRHTKKRNLWQVYPATRSPAS